MNQKISLLALVVLLSLAIAGCSSGEERGEVKLATDSLVETGSFKKSNGEMCKMKANVVVSYPQQFSDSTSLATLQQLFMTNVLKAPQGMKAMKDAIKFYAQSIITHNTPSQYGNTRASNDSIDGDYDEIDIDQFESSVVINVVYNDHDVITFCKEETIKKNDQVTSVSHHYVNFDLQSMKRITLHDLFRDDSLDKISQRLKNQLMDDKDASNEDELNDLGYFNLPNLTVTGNFFFTSSGITWSYDPSVVAVASVGEPTINIDYDDLKDYLSDDSIINRM